MAIVTFYNGAPKDAPKTTMPAHLGANAIITCKDRLLLEKRSDSDVWGLVGGGCKNGRPGGRPSFGKSMKNWDCASPQNGSGSWRCTTTPAGSPPSGTAASGAW